jgi:D-sedoheptulose 7-phosphate isomerase
MASRTGKGPRDQVWRDYVETIAGGLADLVVTDQARVPIAVADAFERWVAFTAETEARDGQVFLIGNGGSAAMASHMAADALKNGHLRALAFNDLALVTATGNDAGYDQVFALPLARLARAGDLLVAISSSGNSPNIVRALETARDLGVAAVTLTAKQPDNRARALGALNFYVPLSRYGWAESAHQIILHCWFDTYLDRHGDGAI